MYVSYLMYTRDDNIKIFTKYRLPNWNVEERVTGRQECEWEGVWDQPLPRFGIREEKLWLLASLASLASLTQRARQCFVSSLQSFAPSLAYRRRARDPVTPLQEPRSLVRNIKGLSNRAA